MGLIDGIKTDMESFLKEKYGEKVKIKTSKSAGVLAGVLNRETLISALVTEFMLQIEERMSEGYWMARFR